MGELSLIQIRDFVIVVLAILSFIVLLGNGIKILREWKKPHDDLESWRVAVDKKLDNDNKRIESIEDGNKVICRGILALLSHEINGNSTEKLKYSQQEITDYLIER